MLHRLRGPVPLAALLATIATFATAAAACADQTSPLAGAGLVAIKSTGGAVTIIVGNPGEVRVVTTDRVALKHFAVSADADGHIMLPQQGAPAIGKAGAPAATPSASSGGASPGTGRSGLGPRSFTIPGLQDGSDGLSIINKGGSD